MSVGLIVSPCICLGRNRVEKRGADKTQTDSLRQTRPKRLARRRWVRSRTLSAPVAALTPASCVASKPVQPVRWGKWDATPSVGFLAADDVPSAQLRAFGRCPNQSKGTLSNGGLAGGVAYRFDRSPGFSTRLISLRRGAGHLSKCA
jgi:hypothetical protein